MVGDKIKELRIEKGLTQKDLADKLFVTAQAVSRWENGDVEPSITTITEISKIFDVSIDEIVGNDNVSKKEPEKEVVVEKVYVHEETKPVLAVCEQCNKPIYEGNNIVRFTRSHGRNSSTSHVICKDCDTDNKRKEHQAKLALAKKRKNNSFIFGTLAALICLAIVIVNATNSNDWSNVVFECIACIMVFTMVSCLFLKNNCIEDLIIRVMGWGFVRMPRLIYSLSLDGIIWLLTVKLLFWILGIILAVVFGLLAIILSMFVSIFVYPFALYRICKHPENTSLL